MIEIIQNTFFASYTIQNVILLFILVFLPIHYGPYLTQCRYKQGCLQEYVYSKFYIQNSLVNVSNVIINIHFCVPLNWLRHFELCSIQITVTVHHSNLYLNRILHLMNRLDPIIDSFYDSFQKVLQRVLFISSFLFFKP